MPVLYFHSSLCGPTYHMLHCSSVWNPQSAILESSSGMYAGIFVGEGGGGGEGERGLEIIGLYYWFNTTLYLVRSGSKYD